MKKVLVLAASALLAVACNPIHGQLKVSKSFNAVQKGFFSNKAVKIAAGTYAAKVDFLSASKIAIKLDVGQLASQSLELNIPQGKYVATYSGPISLSSKESGQPFDVKGTIHTEESRTGSTRAVESCSRTESRTICSDGPVARERRSECRTETITISGQQEVEYHYHDTQTDLSLKIISGGQQVGSFVGQRNSSDKVYDYQGACY